MLPVAHSSLPSPHLRPAHSGAHPARPLSIGDALRACAVQNGCYVLGANQCGRHSETRASFGHSMLVDPWGRVVAGAEGDQADRPGVVFGTVDPAVLDQVRSGLPVHTHQRFKVNGPYDL